MLGAFYSNLLISTPISNDFQSFFQILNDIVLQAIENQLLVTGIVVSELTICSKPTETRMIASSTSFISSLDAERSSAT